MIEKINQNKCSNALALNHVFKMETIMTNLTILDPKKFESTAFSRAISLIFEERFKHLKALEDHKMKENV